MPFTLPDSDWGTICGFAVGILFVLFICWPASFLAQAQQPTEESSS